MTPRKPATEPYDPLKGCMCRVCTGAITVDPAALSAVPDELVETFERASSEAVHASPYGTEDDYIRGGLAAILPMVRALVAEEIEVKAAEVAATAETYVNNNLQGETALALRGRAENLREAAQIARGETG